MLAHYSSQKSALAHLTKNLAREFARDGIRANGVMPGLIGSEGVMRRLDQRKHERGWDEQQVFDAVNEKYHGVTWADRLGTPGEIGDVVAFLASDRASYVNGALVNVDGGSHF
jgi:NAD(P)-dependent dehydrogenase (short-subunit alcohol dehydrogenase family)